MAGIGTIRIPIPEGVKEMFAESTEVMAGFGADLKILIGLMGEIRDLLDERLNG